MLVTLLAVAGWVGLAAMLAAEIRLSLVWDANVADFQFGSDGAQRVAVALYEWTVLNTLVLWVIVSAWTYSRITAGMDPLSVWVRKRVRATGDWLRDFSEWRRDRRK